MSEHHHQAPEETTSPVVEEGVPQEPQEILDEELLESCKQRICPSCDVASEAEEVRLRALAEMENFKKRLQREKDEQTRYATENVLGDLLPTLDNLDLALQYGGQSEACKDMLTGVEMTRKLLLDAVKRHGLEPVGSWVKSSIPRCTRPSARRKARSTKRAAFCTSCRKDIL